MYTSVIARKGGVAGRLLSWLREFGHVVRGWLGIFVLGALGALSLPAGAAPATTATATAKVYTGIGSYGVRWFSDQAPQTGQAFETLQLEVPPVPPEVSAKKPGQGASGADKTGGKAGTAAPSSPGGEIEKGVYLPEARHDGGAKPAGSGAISSVAKSKKSVKARLTINGPGLPTAQERRCLRLEAALRKLRSEMRAGYSAEEGRKMRIKRRELEERRTLECPLA